ncbi:hypothetical protein MYCTH_2130162 [Thermothelomyces thermophilus ATCC 42464]|uniref:Uncharacterized protein n=1 Tax=Thermothelomyces thermophilus (strain ATCC 42464 / BCRC 31852 / DSM 1799) TaxID=573729 RepID=G2QM40_THET4|nr:uncharacterized protein MYCTH_2130162 [Thermothelomyces thermophilus ATCC 42464]AEO61020.1 hypothetical protein MYCTH_2130162 [Thermothelomyces thermophilus ATCC 42464]
MRQRQPSYRTYTLDHSHRWEHLAADMDDRPRAGATKRPMPALCLATAHKIDEDDLVARSAEHGNAEVPTQVLAAHVEPPAGGGPGMGDDGLGDGVASGRYDIGSAAETSSVADINDADNTTVLEREGGDHTTTEASPAAKTSDAGNNIMSERESEDLATAGTSLAASISNAVDATMSEKAGEDNAMTEMSPTAKASGMDNTIIFEREGTGYRQSDGCPECFRDEPFATRRAVPMQNGEPAPVREPRPGW